MRCLIIATVSINSATNLGVSILGIKPSSVSLDYEISSSPGVIKVIWY